MPKYRKFSFAIFSDIHIHNFQFGSKTIHTDQGPINSRALDAVKVLVQIKEYCLANDINTVVFAGDMFHVAEKPPMNCVNLAYFALSSWRDAGLELFMLPGNHDMANKSGELHSLNPFSDIATVCSDVELHCRGDYYLCFVPYRETKDNYKILLDKAVAKCKNLKKPVFLISHVGIQGAKVGADFVLNSQQDVTLDELDLTPFEGAFFGHFHQHQQLAPRAWYVGATHQHNWGDVGSVRGWLHIKSSPPKTKATTKGYEINHIPSRAPIFHVIDEEDVVKTKIDPRDFVRIKHSGENPKVPIEAAHVEYALKDSVEAEVASVDLPTYIDYPSAVRAWIASRASSDLKDMGERLEHMGLEIMAEACSD